MYETTNQGDMKIVTGRWSEQELDDILGQSSKIADAGERISFLSRLFLGTGYDDSTLRGGPETPEELVISLASMDCFTFIDYIEAMRLSRSFAGFVGNLRKVRYRRGEVSFSRRNHFFSDWRDSNADFVEDMTGKIGREHAVRVQKVLNEKEGGASWVPGVPVRQREIDYIPSPMPERVLTELMTGDYAGVYSTAAGLDVSHVGIVVRGDSLILRHASSRRMKVVDQDLREYFSKKPGMIILRPK
jgi:hypothetical protein